MCLLSRRGDSIDRPGQVPRLEDFGPFRPATFWSPRPDRRRAALRHGRDAFAGSRMQRSATRRLLNGGRRGLHRL